MKNLSRTLGLAIILLQMSGPAAFADLKSALQKSADAAHSDAAKVDTQLNAQVDGQTSAAKGALKSESKGKDACVADFMRLCKGKVHGPQEAMQCMADHRSDLSPECQKHEEQRKKDCAPDVEKFCKDAKGDPGKIMGCLRQHVAELSEACRTISTPAHR